MDQLSLPHRGRALGLAVGLLLAGVVGAAAYQDSPLDDPTRPDQERERDLGSHPLEVYDWLGIGPGDTVVDIMPFGGYNSHLLAHIVGPEGHVIAAYAFGQDHVDRLADRFRQAGLDNVEPTLGLDGVADASVDVVLSVRNLHDMYIPSIEERFGFDREEILRSVRRVLKPGGVFGVVDARMPDDGVNDHTHRINEEFAIAELEAHGFELVDRSEILAVPGDDYSEMGFPTRWKVDRFLLEFRRPAE